MTESESRAPSRLVSLGRLLRLSLAPSCIADVLCGLFVGFRGHWPGGIDPLLLLAASPLVYHGSMAINDWADREHDSKTRPDRPIPSGAIEAESALSLGVAMLFGGIALAMIASIGTGMWMGLVAIAAWNYDLRGRGPFLGPFLLGACRAGNVSIGLVLADEHFYGSTQFDALWLLPLAYGTYVFIVSRLGRLEDGEDERGLEHRPRTLLSIAALILCSAPFLPLTGVGVTPALHWTGKILAGIAVLFAARGLIGRALDSSEPWTRAKVGASMGTALRALLFFTAAATMSVGTLPAIATGSALLLLGQPLGYSLRRVFPPS